MKRSFCAIVLFWMAIVPALAGGAPGRPRVAPGGRFLLTAEGRPLFLNADTAWALAWRLSREDAAAYLDHRARQKFNAIALIAFPARLAGAPDGVVSNFYGDDPFPRKDRKWVPSSPVTTPGGDPRDAAQYDYWDHLDWLIDEAGRRGFYVILLPSWGNYVAGTNNGADTSEIIFDAGAAYRHGHWIGARYRDRAHIIWMLGGDRSAVYERADGARDYRPVFRAMAEGVADGANRVSLAKGRDGKADYSTTLMSYHPRKRGGNSSAWFHGDAWLDFNSVQKWPSEQIDAISGEWALAPAKPAWLFEGRYENYRPEYKDWQVRFQAYQTVFAGGHGHTYGHENVFKFGPDWRRDLDAAGAAQMRHLYELMTGTLTGAEFLDRVPDQTLLPRSAGSSGDISSTRLQATRGKDGGYALVYAADGSEFAVQMSKLKGPSARAYWYNPRNGQWHANGTERAAPVPFANIQSGAGAPNHQFDPPGVAAEGNDWVLTLKAK
jgi:hypothetical protein